MYSHEAQLEALIDIFKIQKFIYFIEIMFNPYALSQNVKKIEKILILSKTPQFDDYCAPTYQNGIGLLARP